MHPDESFVERLKAGEAAAYAVLVERFEGPLYRFFYYTSRNHHAAQEQTAETFAQLVRSLCNMRGGCQQLRAYVFATARHVQMRRFRERKQEHARLSDAFDVDDGRPSPAAVAADREELERVLSAIGQLEDPLPEVLLLRFVEGCSLGEVALALGLPVGTVKSHIHRSRARLKQLFAKEEHEQ